MHPGLPSVAALLFSFTPLIALEPPGEESLLTRSSSGLPIVIVRAGAETLRFGIDTGTSRSLVSGAVAKRLRLTPRLRFVIAELAGAPIEGLCGTAPLLHLGDLPIELECLAWIPAELQLAGAEDLDGVLGADALAHVDLWLDLRRDRVRARFAPSGSLDTWTDGTRLRLDVIERRPAIHAEVAHGRGNSTARLVLDSGSNGLALFGRLAERAGVALRFRLFGGRMETVTARRDIAMVRLDSLRIGRLELNPGWAALLPHVVDRTEDGLLPLAALGPVLLDVCNGVVVAGAHLRGSPRDQAR